jgi:outer membrane lipoprotein
VAGVLRGTRRQPLDGTEYTYPVLEVIEIYLWKKEEPYRYYEPYYYDPFYYDPYLRYRRPYPYWWHDPWWYR